jgi:tetratricopeptide (TPR) repeat protein
MSPVDPLQHRLFVGMAMAFIELGRFDEAIVAAKKALRQYPSYSAAYRCLASAFIHLERDAAAREAAARVFEHDPAFTISAYIGRGGHIGRGRQSNTKLLIGFRKLGCPNEPGAQYGRGDLAHSCPGRATASSAVGESRPAFKAHRYRPTGPASVHGMVLQRHHLLTRGLGYWCTKQ